MRITLCGSARFEKSFHEWNERLTLKGHIVYGLAVYPSSKGGNKNWYNEAIKAMLDLVHLGKIDNSDAIVILNENGYIGESTAREIQYAKIKGKQIFSIAHEAYAQRADILL